MKENEPNSLRKLRREKDLSQEYMAYELGISQSTYSDIENGKIELKPHLIEQLVKILHTTVSNLCPISNSCDCSNSKKNEKLIALLKNNNIDIPKELI